MWLVEWIGVFYGAVLGGVLASFGCVVSERVPAGRGVGGRSACVCGRQLRAHENVPVLGWALAQGRARCCGATLPARYVACEAAYAAWGALVGGWLWREWTSGSASALDAVSAVAAFAAFFVILVAATWQRGSR